MAQRKLGRGLETLMGDVQATAGEEVARLPLDQVRAGPHQPRQEFDDTRLRELASSIRETGVLQPIIVREGAAGGYEIVAGERRARAARMAGLEEIPALVRYYSDDEVLILSLVENVQRHDLNPIDLSIHPGCGEPSPVWRGNHSAIDLTHDVHGLKIDLFESETNIPLRLVAHLQSPLDV